MTSPSPHRPKAANESGYAMLLVFLMAAIIAVALYNELPRVAFEAQRAKEQLLIERGEQYKRAIQLFVRKVNRYPATIEELENTNNIRFLRKRYVDPMTGKDKWRLIHVNGGVLTDSIIQKNKPGQDQQPQANTNTFIGEGPVMGATNDPNQQQINPALRRRASDDRPVVTQEAPAETQQPDADEDNSASASDNNDNNDNSDNSDETPAPGTPGAAANIPGMPNQQVPGMPQGRLPMPGMYPPGTYPGQPGFNAAMANQPYGTPGAMPNQMSSPGVTGGFPNNTGQNASQTSSGSVYAAPSLGQTSNVNTGLPTGVAGQPGGFPGRQGAFSGQVQGGFGQSAQPVQMTGFGAGGNLPTGQNANSGVGNNFGLGSASNIQPQGLPGMGGTQVGGGIAGVASESNGPAIKIYNERKKYNEWEFVYDQSKDRGLAGVQRNGGAPGTPAGQMGSMPGQQTGQQPGMGPGGPGGQGGNTVSQGLFSPSSGFGQSTPQQPQPQQPPN